MATTRFIDIVLRSSRAERNINNLDRDMRGLGRSTDRTTSSMSRLTTVAASVSGALAARQVLAYADSFTSVQNQIRQTVITTNQLTERTSQLLDVANRSRTSLSATAELYNQLVLSTENLNLSTEQQLRLTQTISSSFAVSGRTAAESAGAIRQLGQAFAAGALRGDEFNSIAEGAPEIMRALQRSLRLTQGELRAFAATGGITAQVLVEALGSAAEVIDTNLANSTATFAQNLEVATNNITVFVGESAQVQEVIGGAGQAMLVASENLETIISFATLAAVTFGARLIPAITSYTSSVVANTASQLTATRATTGFSAAMGIQAAAATRTTVAVNALSLAATGARGALALIGGPIGAAVIAASAVLLFANNSETAASRSEALQQSVDGLVDSYRDLTALQRVTETSRINQEFRELSSELVTVNAQLNAVRDGVQFRGRAGDIAALESQVVDLNAQLDALAARRQAIFQGGLPEGGQDVEQDTTQQTDTGISARNQARIDATFEFFNNERLATQQHLQDLFDLENGFRTQQEVDEENRYQAQRQRLIQRRDEALALAREDNELQVDLRDEFNNAEIAAQEEHEQRLSQITRDTTQQREDAEAQYTDQVRSMRVGLASQSIGILRGFVGQSRTASLALLAIEKGLAIGQTLINSQVAATRALAELGPIAGPPVAAQMISYGQASAALIAATGIAQAASIGSTSPPSATAGAGATTGPVAASQQAAPQAQEVEQQRVVDIRLDPNAIFTGESVIQLITDVANSGNTDLVVSINDGINRARTIGAIE